MLRLVCGVLLVLVMGRCCDAELIGYEFTGQVLPPGGTGLKAPFGHTVLGGTPITGRFVYDTSSPLTHPIAGCADCAGYAQQFSQGLRATFGTLEVSADDYVIEVRNDIPQPRSLPAQDILRIHFNSALSPPLDGPLIVDGDPFNIGNLSLTFSGGGTLFADSSLPEELAIADFPTRLGFFMDTPSGTVDVAFTINTLERIDEPLATPEPAMAAAWSLGLIALGLWCARRSRQHSLCMSARRPMASRDVF